MTTEDLKAGFRNGHWLDELLKLSDGQDCLIYKAKHFYTNDVIIYIPDVTLNEITAFTVPKPAEVDHIIDKCYSGRDFVNLCDGDEALAYRLWCYCDWQHPSSALPECEYDDEEDKKWAEETYASLVSAKDCTT